VTTSRFELDRLRTQLKPLRLHWFPRLRSTNDHAAALRRRRELYAPAVVLTGHQLAGRGRGGNAWFSGPGSLTVTFAFRAEEHLLTHQLPLVAGLAVREAIEGVLRAAMPADAPAVQLKWPNDILCNGRKLAGLLCERVDRIDLIGVGLNVNLDMARAPRALRDRITSLQRETGLNFDLTDVLSAVAHSLHRRIGRRGDRLFAEYLAEYDRHHALVGKTVTIAGENGSAALTGRCEGLDQQGRLLLRHRQTLHRIIAGHVVARSD
jgi:BirA family transcriptional regulator, biotin operon repressor / biotin---[acetyl-CoA-carboxylase] ligase